MAVNNNRNDDLDFDKSDSPSPSASFDKPSAEIVADLQVISEVFQQIEKETAEIADEIFDWLINVDDNYILSGELPVSDNEKINKYINSLDRLFKFSRNNSEGAFRIITRDTVQELDKKTYSICMCHDGGTSLDILCDIVNEENQARTPNASPVKVTVIQAFANAKSIEIE